MAVLQWYYYIITLLLDQSTSDFMVFGRNRPNLVLFSWCFFFYFYFFYFQFSLMGTSRSCSSITSELIETIAKLQKHQRYISIGYLRIYHHY